MSPIEWSSYRTITDHFALTGSSLNRTSDKSSLLVEPYGLNLPSHPAGAHALSTATQSTGAKNFVLPTLSDSSNPTGAQTCSHSLTTCGSSGTHKALLMPYRLLRSQTALIPLVLTPHGASLNRNSNKFSFHPTTNPQFVSALIRRLRVFRVQSSSTNIQPRSAIINVKPRTRTYLFTKRIIRTI